MSIFDTIVYPDNQNRAKRAIELANDCLTHYARLVAQKGEIEAGLSRAVAATEAIGMSVKGWDGKLVSVNLDSGFTARVPYWAGEWLTRKASSLALSYAAASWAASADVAAADTMAKLVRLPRWLLGSEIFRGCAAVLIADLIFASIKGHDERARLMQMIRESITPREKMFTAVRQNELIISALNGMTIGSETIAANLDQGGIPDASKPAMIAKFEATMMKKFDAEYEAITTAAIRSELSKLDVARKSYTSDD